MTVEAKTKRVSVIGMVVFAVMFVAIGYMATGRLWPVVIGVSFGVMGAAVRRICQRMSGESLKRLAAGEISRTQAFVQAGCVPWLAFDVPLIVVVVILLTHRVGPMTIAAFVLFLPLEYLMSNVFQMAPIKRMFLGFVCFFAYIMLVHNARAFPDAGPHPRFPMGDLS